MLTEYNMYDNTGKQTLHVVKEKKSSLGKGWVAMYKRQTRELVLKLSPLQLKVFVYLCLKQSYELYVVITNKELAKQLSASYNRLLTVMKELETMNVLRRGRFDGLSLIVINPIYTVCGAGTRGTRTELWSLMERYYSLEQAALNETNDEAQRQILSYAAGIAREIYQLVEKSFEGADIDDETGNDGKADSEAQETLPSDNSYDEWSKQNV